jgi:SAM-dependent methyltransferase
VLTTVPFQSECLTDLAPSARLEGVPLLRELSESDAAAVDALVVPRYLSLFGNLVLELFSVEHEAKILHLGCGTGYLDDRLVQAATKATLVGVDPSVAALRHARAKAELHGELDLVYLEASSVPTEFEPASFSHIVTIHPPAPLARRADLFAEAARLLAPGGQALVAMPLRGSFAEVLDLFREYALKHDDAEFACAVDQAVASQLTLETLSDELERSGFDDVDVEVRPSTLWFESHRAFVEDPAIRLFVLPDLRHLFDGRDLGRPSSYLGEAIDKYWSEAQFELSLHVGCASARRSTPEGSPSPETL